MHRYDGPGFGAEHELHADGQGGVGLQLGARQGCATVRAAASMLGR